MRALHFTADLLLGGQAVHARVVGLQVLQNHVGRRLLADVMVDVGVDREDFVTERLHIGMACSPFIIIIIIFYFF